MKTKLLIVVLLIVIIACGVLLGLKYVSSHRNESENVVNVNETISNKIEKTQEEVKPKSKYDIDERSVAVVIDNVGDAIPQTGLNQAMIVYEIYVEGGLTRYMAIFKGANPDTIGPVRSARPVFIDYALENDSIFVHFGGSTRALEDVEKLKMQNISGIVTPSGVFWRTDKKTKPHNALISTKNIWDYAEKRNYRTTTSERNVLNYVVDEVNLEGGEIAEIVHIPYSSSKVKYVYNKETKLYERYVGNNLSTDWLTEEPFTTKNIIITFANNYSTNEENGYGRQEVENIGSKEGYYITNGQAIKITCDKPSRAGKTVYKDLDGNEIKVNDGNTLIQIVNPSMKITLEAKPQELSE